jgi:hypothetical protein
MSAIVNGGLRGGLAPREEVVDPHLAGYEVTKEREEDEVM